jgi:DNA-binding GntR family transcriptional regulator
MRQALDEKELTETELRTMREKVLADRFGVSRDTARKARNDVLESFVESTNDK